MTEIGAIVHYGLYSIYAYDDIESAKRRKISNGSEWYYLRLKSENSFRPISGYKKTIEYHDKYFNNCNYFDQKENLNPSRKNISKFVKQCKTFGFKYIILTAKHHDGFCLFDTKTTENKSNIDICKIFAEECEKINIEHGFYYSWFENDLPFNLNYFNNYCLIQLEEILKLKPVYIWFDGEWKITQKSILNKINELCKEITKKGIKINDRIGKQENYDYCSYRVKTDRLIQTANIIKDWQYVGTIGYSWGFNKYDDYKDGKELYKIYTEVKNFDGSFLLNIGPREDFTICSGELQSLSDFFNVLKL
jgi:alpha-L-fucosidase